MERAMTTRRRFIAGGAAAAGAAWATPSILTIDAASAASCSGVPGTVDMSTSPPTVTAPSTPANNLAQYQGSGWTLGTFGGVTVAFRLSGSTQYAQFGAAGTNRTTLFRSGTTGGVTGYWRLDRDKTASGTAFIPDGIADGTILEIVFSQPVCNFTTTLLDVDQNLAACGSSQWTDQVRIQPFLGADPVSGNYTPAATLDPNTPQAGSDVTFTGNSGCNVGDGSASANIGIVIPTEIDRLRITHAMAMPVGEANTGDRQHIGVFDMSWT